MSAPIRVVYFDIGGVLIDADLDRYLQLGCAIFEAKPEDLEREVALRVPRLEKGNISSANFWKEIGESLWHHGKGKVACYEDCRNLWKNLMLSTVSIDVKVVRVCKFLNESGFMVGVLTNVIEEHAQALSELGVYEPFNPCVLSCRVGMRKPDPEIFQFAAAKAGVKMKECLFVDDLQKNVQAAQNAGMNAILFTNAEQLCADLQRLKLIT